MKVLLPEHSANPDLLTRFLGEAKAASRIGHDNIVRIDAKGTLAGGRAFVAMEYLDGVGLDGYLQAQPCLSLDQALAILVQIGAALEAAHARGIVHRDIKPPNIFVTHKPGFPIWIKVLDFGIARFLDPRQADGIMTREGVVIGTPAFMPPEQAVGAATVAHRADIYALGVIAHMMVTGQLPQRDASGVAWRSPRELRADLPEGWSTAMLWALEFHASARPARCTDWLRALVAATPNGSAIVDSCAPGLLSAQPAAAIPTWPAGVATPTPVPTTLGTASGSLTAPAPARGRYVLYAVTVAIAAVVAFMIPTLARRDEAHTATTNPTPIDASVDAAVALDAAVIVPVDAATAQPDAPADAPAPAREPPPRKRPRPAKPPTPSPRRASDRGAIPAAADDIIE